MQATTRREKPMRPADRRAPSQKGKPVTSQVAIKIPEWHEELLMARATLCSLLDSLLDWLREDEANPRVARASCLRPSYNDTQAAIELLLASFPDRKQCLE